MPSKKTTEIEPSQPEDIARAAQAVANNDLRALAWAWLARLSRVLDVDQAAHAASWARLLQRLGPEANDAEMDALYVAVYGGGIHGIPPRTAEQWEYAQKVFDAQTFADMQSWTRWDDEREEGAGDHIEGEWKVVS